MTAKKLAKTVKDFLGNNPEIKLTSPLMYDSIVLEKKVSFMAFNKDELGVNTTFIITIEENIPSTN
jgi:hypothetical protein